MLFQFSLITSLSEMDFSTELNICQQIFGEDISIKNDNLQISTPYGIVHLHLSQKYPTEPPEINVTNSYNTSTHESLQSLREKATKMRECPMVYPLILHFYNFHEQCRASNRNTSQSHIFEISYDLIEESDLKMTKQDFLKWMKTNVEIELQPCGLSGKQYFLDLKKDDKNTKF